MDERGHLPAAPTYDELVAAGVRVRPGSDPTSRRFDPLERYLQVPNHAIFLFTAEDAILDRYLRDNWAALDGLSGEACDIHISLVQLLGGADVYSQFEETKSLPGLSSIQPTDLPALHIWSSSASITVSLRRFDDEVKLRDVLRTIFAIVQDAGGPIHSESVNSLSTAVQSIVAASTHVLIGQHLSHSSAGRDIIQITNMYPQRPYSEMNTMNPKEELSNPKPQRQSMEDVASGGKITQRTDAAGGSQTMRRADATSDITQRKSATPTMSLGWGRATGLGIVGLVVAFLAWLAYSYFSH